MFAIENDIFPHNMSSLITNSKGQKCFKLKIKKKGKKKREKLITNV